MTGNLVKRDLDAEDNAVMLMQYPNAMGIAEASWTQIGKLTSYNTVIYGSKGTLFVEPEEGRLLHAADKHPGGEEVTVPEPHPQFLNPTAHFFWGIESGEDFHPLCQPANCRDVQEILEAGAMAAAKGACVDLLR